MVAKSDKTKASHRRASVKEAIGKIIGDNAVTETAAEEKAALNKELNTTRQRPQKKR